VTAKYLKPSPGAIPDARLRRLAGQIHSLGPYPLAHLLAELAAGAPLGSRLEAYAALAPLRNFIAELGGRELPPPARLMGAPERTDMCGRLIGRRIR
jgi:hypothetical protein